MARIPDELRQVIARNIKHCRLQRFSGRGGVKKCAEAFGVMPQQWSPWEKGRRTPDKSRMQQIASFFGVTVDYLYLAHPETASDDDEMSDDFVLRHRRSRCSTGERVSCCPRCGLSQPGQPFTPNPIQYDCRMVELFEQFIISIQKNGLPVRLLPPE
jgi:Predicted transcriptional regulators